MPHTKHLVYSSVRFKPNVPPRVNGLKSPFPSKGGNPQISIVNVPEPPPRPGYTMGIYNEKKPIPFEKSNPPLTGSPGYNEPKLPIRKCDRQKDQATTVCSTKVNVFTSKQIINEPVGPNINGRCNKASQIRQSEKAMRRLVHFLALLLLLNSALIILHYTVKSPHHCSTDKEDEKILIGPKYVHERNEVVKTAAAEKRSKAVEGKFSAVNKQWKRVAGRASSRHDRQRHSVVNKQRKMTVMTASSRQRAVKWQRQTIAVTVRLTVPYRHRIPTTTSSSPATTAITTTIAEKPEYSKCVYRQLYSRKEGLSMMCEVLAAPNTTSLDQCLQHACRTRQANAINFLYKDQLYLGSSCNCRIKRCDLPLTDRGNLELTDIYGGSNVFIIVK